MKKTKPIDAHGEALDLLKDERDALESALRDVKPKINDLNRCQQAGDTIGYNLRTHLWNGNISRLTKHRNDLQRRLKNVEESRKLLKRDRALIQIGAWEDAQFALEAAKIAALPVTTVMPCGCW